VPPADQRLDTGEASIAKSHQRLELKEELAFVLEGLSQFGHQREPAGPLPFVFGRVSHEGTSWLLRDEQGDVRAAQQRVRVITVIRRQRDADTDRDVEMLALHLEGTLEDFEKSRGRQRRRCGIGFRQQDRELVTAEPSDHILGANLGAKARTNLFEKAITSLVTEGFVDFLEVVQVKNEHGNLLVRGPGRLDRLPQPVGQLDPVR
jgi:hypothetical protein